ncbi:SIMPL domain-containing protein [Mycolicibacterium litorale]|nr:SIMPL domain-containing protein [Mycolicibacterium litorale]
MQTEITVRGSSKSSHPPQRGTVRASISYEGPEMEPVYSRVARDLETVRTSMADLQAGDDAPIMTWSAERLRTWSNRPWNQDGEQLPLVHHASVGLNVEFRDFAALSGWVREHVAGTEGFRVDGIRWTLTPERRDEVIRQVRSAAVHDAVARAQLYADAVGLGMVSPVAIADTGMLDSGSQSGGNYSDALAAAPDGAVRAGYEPFVELVPEDIEVFASVDARFVAERSEALVSNSREGSARSQVGEVGEFGDEDAG